MQFSVIIPTYQRLHNLRLVIASLEAQRGIPVSDWEVIIADDGSTDGTRTFCKTYPQTINLRYQWCGPNQGFRPHRTRNIGIAQALGKWLILLDSDVVLNPDALAEHSKIREKFPDIVVIGLYHWSVKEIKVTEEQIREDFEKYVMPYVPAQISGGPPMPGLDCRVGGFTDHIQEDKVTTNYDGLGFFGGNISWPVDLFWELGGFDEKMPNGMGEDAELGQYP